MRIGGLATGLDTDTMVKQMMMPYQMKADRVKQDKILLEYRQELYRDVAKDVKNIYTKYFDISSTSNKDTNLVLSSNYDTVKFSSGDSSVITARGLAGAKTGNYEVTVKQKAEASSLVLEKTSLKDQESLELSFGKETVKIDLTGTNGDMKAIASNINKAIEDHNKQDGATKIDVKVSSSELGENIRIESSLTGEKNKLEMTATTVKGDVVTSIKDAYVEAKDAEVIIKDAYGNEATKKFESNKFVIDNVEYTINGVSKNTGTESAPKYESTRLTGVSDSDKIIENVSAFVEDYNKLIDKVNGLMNQKNNKNYRPLTDEQKKEMSETEVKLWEAKSKEGLLRNDDILYGFSNELLGHLTSNGGENTLKAIGITPNPDYRTQKGKITLDEDALRKAFETNGEETRKTLTSTFNKIKDTFNETAISSTSKIAKRAGMADGVTAFNNEISKKIELQQKEYEKVTRSLSKKEQRYYSDFARLEVAMNKANAMMGQFVSMGGM